MWFVSREKKNFSFKFHGSDWLEEEWTLWINSREIITEMMISRRYWCRKCLTHGRKEFIEHIRKRNNRLTSSFISADEMINPNPSFSDIFHIIIEISIIVKLFTASKKCRYFIAIVFIFFKISRCKQSFFHFYWLSYPPSDPGFRKLLGFAFR